MIRDWMDGLPATACVFLADSRHTSRRNLPEYMPRLSPGDYPVAPSQVSIPGMSKIKSAMELALERTAGIEVDKTAVKRDEFIRRGKAAAGAFLSNGSSGSPASEMDGLNAEEKAWVKQGITETLLANLTLPRYENDIAKLDPIFKGLTDMAVAAGSETSTLDYLSKQFSELFSQYLGNLDQLEEQLRSQWEPRLRQKEQQLRQQTGRSVQLTPEQDPEFGKVLSDELSRIDAQYAEVLNQGKAEIKKLI